MTDQNELADIAENAYDPDIRKSAVKKVTDQKQLADIAKNDSYSSVRKKALESVTDQKLLADIAKKRFRVEGSQNSGTKTRQQSFRDHGTRAHSFAGRRSG
ncbi:hypothetical protein QUF80_02430 [Desulfococcaceae bacterium HSG8]|nr:hypothetical protein [Desulfococcaceae bacterium HSG8]